MLVNIIAQSSPRARTLPTQRSSSRVLGPAGVSLLGVHHREQTRAYRFGVWSSYLDPEFQKDIRRRHRMLKYKYAETMNRRLSWDQPISSEDSRAILRRMVGRYWFPAGSRCGSSRFVSMDNLEKGKRRRQAEESKDSNPDNKRPDESSNSAFWIEYDSWRSQLNDAVSHWTKQAYPGAKRAKSNLGPSQSTLEVKTEGQEDARWNSTPAEEEYVFDPISNRMVLRGNYGSAPGDTDAAVNSFKSYRSQFRTLGPPQIEEEFKRQPVHSNGPPPVAELEKYNDVKIDEIPTGTSQTSDRHAAVDAYLAAQTDELHDKPIYSEEYALNHLPPEEAADVYDDLHKYTKHEHDEIEDPVEEPTQQYDDLDKYKPYRYNEPNASKAQSTSTSSDLRKYRPFMHDESSKMDEPTPQKYEDLDQYTSDTWAEDVNSDKPIPKYKDLDKYEEPYHYREDSTPSSSTIAYEDLGKYHSPEFSEPTSFQESEPFQQYGDLDKYKAFRYQEPDGKATLEKDIVGDCLKEFDLKNERRESLEQDMESHLASSDLADTEIAANLQTSRKITQENHKPKMTGYFVRDFPEEFATKWEVNTGSMAGELQPKNEMDFSPSESDVAYEREMQARIQSAEKENSDNLTTWANSAKLESTLDRKSSSIFESSLKRSAMSRREREEAEVDPYGTDPQGLETSYADECGTKSTGPTFVKTYGSLQSKDAQEPEPTAEAETSTLEHAIAEELAAAPGVVRSNEPSPDTETTVYKILAYDPTMQSINIAETTSVVPDQAAPLTPAEVLLRLSNPSKFFPHFAPLQKEGFEIVSGSGDVLVFRKVRPAAPSASANSVNPIDMMGKPTALPNAAAFASPTGFINYDIPPVEETQDTPFQSNIDVRREEPVFSGPKSSTEEGGKKKRSTTKKVLVGGIWVAGFSYATGVVLEYFNTGGIDGKGPSGL